MNDETFGFTVRRNRRRTREDLSDQWAVALPHQCDYWDIAGETLWSDVVDGVPHAEAVSRLERFVVEAQAALAALRDRREVS